MLYSTYSIRQGNALAVVNNFFITFAHHLEKLNKISRTVTKALTAPMQSQELVGSKNRK